MDKELMSKLEKGFRKILKRHAPLYGATGVSLRLKETKIGFSLDFNLKFKEDYFLPGVILITKALSPKGFHTVALYLFPRMPLKGLPPWVMEMDWEGKYALGITHFAKGEELLKSVDRLYLHMAFIGFFLEPKEAPVGIQA